MNNPLGVSLVKGIREPHEVKKKSFDLGGNRTHDLRIRSTVTLPTELRAARYSVCSVFFSDCECQSKEIGVGMEVRLLSVGARAFLSRRFATRLRGFAAKFCHLQREKNLWHPG